MGRNSKRRLPSIPALGSKKTLHFINQDVAFNSKLQDESKAIRISFENYNISECEIHKFTKTESKAFVKALKALNQSSRETLKGILRPQPYIKNIKPYQKLFNGLSDDVDYLLEIPFTQAGRIFFHMIGSECYVVSACKEHKG